MKLHRALLVASTLLATSGLALAHNGDGDDFVAPTAASTASRADILADLAAYQKSGLAELNHSDSVDAESLQYKAAEQRYEKLRSAAHPTQAATGNSQGTSSKATTAKSAFNEQALPTVPTVPTVSF